MSGTQPGTNQGTSSLDVGEIGGKLLDMLGPAVVQGVLQEFNTSGLAAKVNSWLGRGPNEPITAEQIRDVLSNQKLQEIARTLGIPADRAAEILAKVLPQAVDKASPDGRLASG